MKTKIVLIAVLLIVILGSLVYLNSYSSKEKSLEIVPNPNGEINYEDPNLGGNDENINNDKPEVPKVDNNIEVKVNEKKISCEKDGGVWFSYNSSCEINSLSQNECLAKGGEYNECNSACRHDKEAVMCTMQCVMTCTFK